jgi:hypothetical protein
MVEDEKTLTLDGYQAMINTGILGREGVSLFSIVIYP